MKHFILTLAVSFFAVGCGKDAAVDIQETGQQIGDVMASIDETGGNSGSLAALESAERTYVRLAPDEVRDSAIERLFSPSAYATSCGMVNTFNSCANNVITRTFGGCTVLGATFAGTVTLFFNDGAVDGTCRMAVEGDSVSRSPDFTVTGRRGATLSVSKTGTNGQVITRGSAAGSFTFSNDGIRRVFATAAGTTLFDYTTTTTSPITVTGQYRTGRTLNGGALRVTNNLTQVSCDYAPIAVAWDSSCNCANSGSWTGTCSDGKTTTLQITGCGTATLSVGDEQENFSFDRCYTLGI